MTRTTDGRAQRTQWPIQRTILRAGSVAPLLAACVLSGSFTAGCSDSREGEVTQTIVVGGIVPRTGPQANGYWISAIELAAAEMNEALRGEKLLVELDLRDDAGELATGEAIARELFSNGTPVLIADNSTSTSGANKVNYDPNSSVQVPIVCGICTNPGFHVATTTKTDPLEQDSYRDLDVWMRRTTITGGGRMNITVRELISRGADGDLNGDGIIKFVMFAPADDASTFKSLQDAAQKLHPDPTLLRFEEVKVVLDGEQKHDYAPDLMAAFDEANGTTGESDGAPDYALNFLPPTYAPGLIKAYKLGRYETVPMTNGSSFHRISVLQTLGDYANGQEVTVNQPYTNDASGTHFAEAFEGLTGVQPAGYDSNIYDAAALALLGVVKSALPLEDRTKVTPSQVKEALAQLNAPGGKVIGTGPEEFKKAIAAVREGAQINYEGASGPCDFDSVGDVKARVSYLTVENQRFVEKSTYDCTIDSSCPRQ